MYRWIRQTPLDTGHKYGDVLKDGDLPAKSIARFLETGSLVRVSSPPLAEIPAFEERAETLEPAGVVMISDLVEANATELAKKINKSASTVRRWQSEAMQWLAPDQIKKSN